MSNNIDIKALSMAVNSLAIERARMMNISFGKSGNTKRTRIYQEFGYPENLTFDECSAPKKMRKRFR
ncbi:TPA: hypothetical protein ACNRFC_000143 [Yersinia enterocolitica]